MPELPDIRNYVAALERFVVGKQLRSFLIRSPFVLRTYAPPPEEFVGKKITSILRLGKRIVLQFEDELLAVVHLMISGRFQWKPPESKPTRKTDLAALQFENGTLLLTEASGKKRASLHLLRGHEGLVEHRRSGLSVEEITAADFAAQLTRSNRTLKRCLTDPNTFDGIGNAYSDEILHAARLSPLKQTRQLTEGEVHRLLKAAQVTLAMWTQRLAEETGDQFPKKVTAFHPKMAVHGRFGKPCPDCGKTVQRIVFSEREFNYCPGCQTNGRLLKDRSLSRLLKDDWPATIDEA
ncbi:MAG: Fpg/Nei family DNA glycosylase [Fuerstiella sp.]